MFWYACVDLDASSTVRKALHLAATLILISAVGAADCPEECVCMWKNGKETTECINRDKDSIPQGIEPSTQASQILSKSYIWMKNNYIKLMKSHSVFEKISIYIFRSLIYEGTILGSFQTTCSLIMELPTFNGFIVLTAKLVKVKQFLTSAI